MTRHSLNIEIDENGLRGYSASYLALAWHAAQANPAPHGDRAAGKLVEHIGREIIRRWLGTVEPELWHHQGDAHYWRELCKFAKYVPGENPDPTRPGPNPEFENGTWVPRDPDELKTEKP